MRTVLYWLLGWVRQVGRRKAYILDLVDRYPHVIVHLLPLRGYYFLFIIIYQLVVRGFGPEGVWDDSIESIYIPTSPKPYAAFSSDYLDPEITFVTAYFNLGRFQKGETEDLHFDLDTYITWMNGYAKFNNNVIAFTDLPQVATQLSMLRQNLPAERTKIYIVNQVDTWAFNLAPKIEKIFSQPDYPKHHPNTVLERYPCAMHVKYELLEKVIRDRMHRTRYLAWIDIGYFRESSKEPFHLKIPQDYREDHVAFLQMDKFEYGRTASTIIKDNVYWVAGGMFIGRPEYLIMFIEDYMRTVENLISRGQMSTDQQVIYVMYTKSENAFPRIPVQTYSCPCKTDWFYLGGLCRRTWQSSIEQQKTFMEVYHQSLL